MASTSVIALWGEASRVLLMVADNANVLARTSTGYAKKGGIARPIPGHVKVDRKDAIDCREFLYQKWT